jgi:hypothetical protein
MSKFTIPIPNPKVKRRWSSSLLGLSGPTGLDGLDGLESPNFKGLKAGILEVRGSQGSKGFGESRWGGG